MQELSLIEILWNLVFESNAKGSLEFEIEIRIYDKENFRSWKFRNYIPLL